MARTERLESTATLLARVREGDQVARDQLCSAYLPLLTRWAHGRLPGYARDMAETDDLVQITLLRALNRMDEFVPTREGAFLAYLRRILINSIREEIRRVTSRPGQESISDELSDERVSTVEQAIGSEMMEHYETALARLSESEREAILLRVEFGFTYPEIASAMESPSANAARMMVSRALRRLVEEMP